MSNETAATSAPEPGRTRRRRRATAAAVRAPAIAQLPWHATDYLDAPIEPADAAGVAAVNDTAIRVLEEIGIEFLHPDACALLADAGCEVSGTNVRMSREFVAGHAANAPEIFTITPRNRARAIEWGGRRMTFGAVASPPNASDLGHGRRVGVRADFQALLKLTQYFNCIHFNCGYPVEPVDVHASVRHLDALYDMLTLTDKVAHIYSLGPERVEDGLEMARIASGLTLDEFDRQPHLYTNINSSSPLKHDWPMLDGAMRMARRGQPVIITPFTLSGAMAPVTIAGAVAQQTAEALAAIALLQLINPGTPVVMGSFTSNVDMKSGAPAFGTPEYIRATQLSGQMARLWKLPFRASNACAANFPDGQAMWESMQSLWGATTAHANVVYHAAGWLEGGLCASMEKFVMDCEMLQEMIAYNQPLGMSEDDLAFDAIRDVGPHDHFLGADHTQARYRTAFYQPFASDLRNFEAWEEAGAPQAHERAARLCTAILEEYEAPPIDAEIERELRAFVEMRRAQGGAPTDY